MVEKFKDFHNINEDMKINRTGQWLYTIKIKDILSESDDKEAVLKVAKKLKRELERVSKSVSNNKRMFEDEKTHYVFEIEDILDNLDFLIKLINEEIPKEDWGDYSFDGDFVSYLNNECLEMVYDLGDSRTTLKNGDNVKFLFVK